MNGFPEAILIDLDDTLLDESGERDSCWADACAPAVRRTGMEFGTLRRAIDAHAGAFWSDPENHRRGRLDLRAATRGVVEEAFSALGISDRALARETAELYRDLREERQALFPGATEALERLRAEGVRLRLMTNGAGAAQRAKIERFGLEPYFGCIVIEGEFGAGKPDTRVFEALLSALDAGPEDAWAIGDNLEFDVLAPMRLGLHGIWVDGPGLGLDGRQERPNRVVRAFTEITHA